MHTANQEDPIMLATIVKNLCHSFGQISRVSISTIFESVLLHNFIYIYI